MPRTDPSDQHRNAPAGRPATDCAGREVLDVQGLVERCLGNLDFVERVLARFQERFPQELAELESLVALNDAERIARVAHRIKGSSANVSAEGLHHVAAEIEQLGRAGRVAEIPPHVEQLRREWTRYLGCATLLSGQGPCAY